MRSVEVRSRNFVRQLLRNSILFRSLFRSKLLSRQVSKEHFDPAKRYASQPSKETARLTFLHVLIPDSSLQRKKYICGGSYVNVGIIVAHPLYHERMPNGVVAEPRNHHATGTRDPTNAQNRKGRVFKCRATVVASKKEKARQKHRRETTRGKDPQTNLRGTHDRGQGQTTCRSWILPLAQFCHCTA
jgi:hypothetical protein